jgi:SagB-type dehydrogenase family enzyme
MRSGAGVRYRRSPFVMSYWSHEGLVFHNYATGIRTGASPVVFSILDFFAEWRSLADLQRESADFDPISLKRAVSRLVSRSLLQRSDRPRRVEQQMETWGGWNPVAGFFHFSTRDLRYRAAEVATAQLAAKSRRVPVPPAVKRLSRRPRVALPPARTEGALPEVLLARRTWRRFSPRGLPVQDLATLLDLTFGVQEWMNAGVQGRAPLKTSPSGGARHPIEAYVLALRVDGLARGLYHYASDRHALTRLRARATPQQLVSYLPTQWWYGEAAALVLMTAVFARSQWRYDFARGYRAVLLEAGHVCQTFCLVATWLGLAPFCSMALADSRIEKDLGVDGVTESVLYAAGVGMRPAGVTSAQRPPRRRRS